MDVRRGGLILLGLAVMMGAGTCQAPATPPATVSPAPPSVVLLTPPMRLCSRATQLRLEVRVSHETDALAGWTLSDESGRALAHATWQPADGPLLIPFPDHQPLPGGVYELRLDWGDTPLVRHTFEVATAPPRITRLDVSLLPLGQAVQRVPAATSVLFINTGYKDGCLGAPCWLTVQDGAGHTVCGRYDTLATMEDDDAFACYRPDGEPLAPGTYTATFTLADDIARQTTFAVIPPSPPTPQPTATATATPAPPRCRDPFVAAGLTSDGEPFLPLTLFDWYTQVVYAGVRCRGLASGQAWHAAWYHEGKLVRTTQSTWQGPAEGVVWDSLTGVPGDPFLRPGTYTVTLQIVDTAFDQTFDVYAYPSPKEE